MHEARVANNSIASHCNYIDRQVELVTLIIHLFRKLICDKNPTSAWSPPLVCNCQQMIDLLRTFNVRLDFFPTSCLRLANFFEWGSNWTPELTLPILTGFKVLLGSFQQAQNAIFLSEKMSGRKTETWSVPTSPQSGESSSLILHFGAGIWAKWVLGDGGGHCLVFSISWRWLWRASLFLKLRSARSVAAREDTEEEANWWSMTPLWKDDRALGFRNSHGLRRLILAAHLRRETAVLAPLMKRPIIAFGLCSWPPAPGFY